MSSDSDTASIDYDNLSKNIIIEVEKRPALYDKSLKQYKDRNIKARLWQEVYQNVCREWTNLSEADKKNKGSSIQKKWKNMKDCFAKELAAHQGKSGQAAPPKKRKYVHFDSMLFLIPSMQKRETSSNIMSSVSPQDINVSSPASTQDRTLPATAQNSQPQIALRKKNCSGSNNSIDYEKQLLDILKEKQVHENEDDEEKNFALMLVPMLRKLNEDQKHYAKIEILNVLKKARSHSSPQPSQHVFNQPSQFRKQRICSSPLYHQTYTQPQNTNQYSPQSSCIDTIYSIPSPSETLPPTSPAP
ncbi:transcription factor Adf-1-like [Colias croceus]|uniref:transcription factor Adf-1-like n=1 Tax=Colias crocea TaxID=72248 RepID=UPI001E27D282|nr:transcription factor Adf-1-like [Colias croceus]